MVREIMRDEGFLRMPSRAATAEDAAIADDLLDTLRAHLDGCVGMAANMIGRNVRIIVYMDGTHIAEMFNPVIERREDPYEAREGCLSLDGTRPVTRWRRVKLRWQTRDMKPRVRNFEGFTAEILQHEIDHLEGVII